MKKYKKKPVEVEAVQLNIENAHDIMNWLSDYTMGTLTSYPTHRTDIPFELILEIETLEGKMRATNGDYIVKGVRNEIYPVRRDIFEETYEEVTLNGSEV